MARIPQETINRINDTADIVEIVSKYVDLKIEQYKSKEYNTMIVRKI